MNNLPPMSTNYISHMNRKIAKQIQNGSPTRAQSNKAQLQKAHSIKGTANGIAEQKLANEQRGDEIQAKLKLLDEQLKRRNPQQTGTAPSTIKMYSADDLSPIRIEQTHSKQKQEICDNGEAEFEEIFRPGLPAKILQQKICELRKNPVLLTRYVKTISDERNKSVIEEKKAALIRRKTQRQLMCALTKMPPRPLIENFPLHNIQQVDNGYFQSPKREFRLFQNQLLQETYYEQASCRRARSEMDRRQYTLRSIEKAEESQSSLPLTFISQRNKLMKFMFFAARFSQIAHVCNGYKNVHQRNEQIKIATIQIQKMWRGYNQHKRFGSMCEAIVILQQVGRKQVGFDLRAQYVQSLQTVKIFFQKMYFYNTALGTGSAYSKSVECIVKNLQFKYQQFAAIQEFVLLKLLEDDKKRAYKLAQSKLYQEELQIREQKKGKKQEDPKLEFFVPTKEQVGAFLNKYEAVSQLSRLMTAALKRKYQDTFELCYRSNIDAANLRFSSVSLAPTDDFSNEMLTQLYDGVELAQIQHYLESAEGVECVQRKV